MANEWQSGFWQTPWPGPEYPQTNSSDLRPNSPLFSSLPSPAGSERWAGHAVSLAPYLAYRESSRPTAALAFDLRARPGEAVLAEDTGPRPELLPAYEQCTSIIRKHSASFYFSAGLLPRAKRQAVLALYAFCRLSDEMVDSATGRERTPEAAEAALADWAQRCRAHCPGADETELVLHAWADTRRRFRIPQALADELLAGVSMDISISRYATWADLWIYCYRVASTVGQMSMHITGANHTAAVNYAIRLGVALQLTNILRDVGEDASQGRIYLPLADLARFGYSPRELLAGVVNDRFVALMQFEITRARRLYAQAWPGISMLERDSRTGVAAAATIYQEILARIEGNGYDVFNNRARVPNRAKLALLPGIWWKVQQMDKSPAQVAGPS